MKIANYLKSPINYAGSKYRLIRKGFLDYFPKEINTFIDAFSGACNVGLNVAANKIICNDIISFIPELFSTWQMETKEQVNNRIDEQISKFQLSSTNKENFENFRSYYNKERDIEDLFILLCYSFNYQMRFNSKHEFNGSFGKEASTMNDNIRNNLNLFIDKIQSVNIFFQNNDFRDVDYSDLTAKDFVYFDSPYSIMTAVYQDGKRGFKGWNNNDDLDLFELCDGLDKRGAKFALSNVRESKGKINKNLDKWSKKYNVIHIDMNYSGANYHRTKSKKDDEVLIMNY